MAGRRFGPLIVLVLLATGLIVARLFQVQVRENEVWADEAVKLVRSGAVLPYDRGRILDRRGRVLAHDEEVYRIEFRYRDFRRGHPLGQVAHAWSALAQRPVPLPEVFDRFREVAHDLVRLTNAELAAFAEGGALQRAWLSVPAVDADRAAAELRLGRRADVRFYMGRLLGLDRRQAVEAVRAEGSPSLFAYAMKVRHLKEDELAAELEARLERAEDDLLQLAVLVAASEDDGFEGPSAPEVHRARLIERLEDWREDVEDATAAELFREAAGFSAGRVAADVLLERFDLDWLAALLRWDDERIGRWARDAREGWEDALTEWHLERLAYEVQVAAGEGNVPDTVIAGWARLFLADAGDEGPGLRPLVVFDQLDSLFEMRVPRRMRVSRRTILPLQDPALAPFEGAGFADLARLELWSGEEPPAEEEVSERAEEWARPIPTRAERDRFVELLRARILAWDARLQGELEAQLALLAERAGTERLSLSEGRLDRAEERARSVLKDRGSRPTELAGRPDYALVHLLTRYPDRFDGFLVRESTERMRLEDERGVTVLGPLLGNVRAPGLADLMVEREDFEKLTELRSIGRRTTEQNDELIELVKDVTQLDEALGGDGIEGHFDRELSGKNGYEEQHGLHEMRSGKGGTDIPPEDGLDLALTLDVDLQRVAIDCLRDPAVDPRGTGVDYKWNLAPTGAIVLARVDGDVLVAASFPDLPRGPEAERRTRDLALERTLRRPGFQPPGSVFKPFVAAWAIDHLAGYDPSQEVGCLMLEDGSGPGWKGLRCWKESGHGYVGLHQALGQSCNSYFAALGERLSTEDFRGLTREFGFGQPTGVRTHPERGGLREDYVPQLLRKELEGRELLMAGNGLGVIEVTPMQVARAYAGLATGRLPEMRLVDRVGGEPLPRRSRPLAISRAALDRVRAGLWEVTNGVHGSGHAALSTEALGRPMSAKTGSADFSPVAELATDGKMRVPKHTWLAGWFPPDDPEFVLVVFVQKTLATSGHSSIWIARDFLQRDEVRSFLDAELEGR